MQACSFLVIKGVKTLPEVIYSSVEESKGWTIPHSTPGFYRQTFQGQEMESDEESEMQSSQESGDDEESSLHGQSSSE